jgi:ABC-2 type transport system ATP-binding protein
MRILTGYHWQSAGTAKLDGYDVVEDALEVKKRVGYLPETPPVYPDLNVSEYLDFTATSHGLKSGAKNEAIERAVEICALKPVFFVPIDKLSKGFRQRVGLAQAILHDPGILILDEPTSGLDPNQILEIRSMIRKLGEKKTVILSTHILQEVEALCREVLIMNEGRIVAEGSTETIAEAMKGEERFDLVLKGRLETIQSSCGSLAGLKPIGELEKLGEGLSRLRVVAGENVKGEEGAEILFDWAVATGIKILEMRRERLSLEEIFVKLTKEEKTP